MWSSEDWLVAGSSLINSSAKRKASTKPVVPVMKMGDGLIGCTPVTDGSHRCSSVSCETVVMDVEWDQFSVEEWCWGRRECAKEWKCPDLRRSFSRDEQLKRMSATAYLNCLSLSSVVLPRTHSMLSRIQWSECKFAIMLPRYLSEISSPSRILYSAYCIYDVDSQVWIEIRSSTVERKWDQQMFRSLISPVEDRARIDDISSPRFLFDWCDILHFFDAFVLEMILIGTVMRNSSYE
jgi:hypothetical protein